MPVQHSVLPDQSLLFIDCSEVVTNQEMLSDMSSFLQNPMYQPGTPILSDFSRIERFEMAFINMASIVARLESFFDQMDNPTKSSIFAPDDLPFGMARMFGQLADAKIAMEVGIFRSEAESLSWLGRPEQEISQVRQLLDPN